VSELYLERVALTHFGCHQNRSAELGPGLNLICGPNGAGKSTLFQAILIALTERHSSSNRSLQNWVPWGCDGLGPTVELHLVCGGARYRIRKTFVHNPACEVEPLNGSKRLFNKPAESLLDSLLQDDGAAGLLLRALWGDHDATALIHPARVPSQNRSAPAALLQPLLDVSSPNQPTSSFSRLRQAAWQAYEERFTPGRQQIRKGSKLFDAAQRLDCARQQQKQMEDLQSALSSALDRLAEAQAGRRQAEADWDEARRAVANLRPRAEHYHRFQTELAAKQSALQTAQRDLEALEQAEAASTQTAEAHAALDRAERAAADAQRQHEQAQSELSAARQRHDQIEERLGSIERLIRRRDQIQAAQQTCGQRAEAFHQAENDLRTATDRLDAARAAFTEAENQLALLRTRAAAHQRARQRDALRERLQTLQTIESELARLEAAGAKLPVPTDQELEQIRTCVRELDALNQALDEQPVAVSIQPERPIELRVQDASGDRILELSERAGQTLALGEELILILPGFGRIELRRTGPQAEQRRARRNALAQQLETMWTGLGVSGLPELERRITARQQRHFAETRRDDLLSGETPDALHARLAELEHAVQEDGLRTDPEPPPSELAQAEQSLKNADAARTRADREWAAAAERLRNCEQELRAAQQSLQEQACGDPDAALDEIRSQIDAALADLDRLGATIQAATPNEITACRQQLQSALEPLQNRQDAASVALNQARQTLSEAATEHRLRKERLDEMLRTAPADPVSRREAIDRARQEADRALRDYETLRQTLPPDPADELAHAESRLNEAETRKDQAIEDHHAAERQLAELQGQDYESRRVQAVEELAAAEDAYQREARDAAAWALLHLLCQQAAAEATRSVASRLAALADPSIERLTAGNVRAIEIQGDGLEPIRARSRQFDELFGVDRFSRGTREQVLLGCRLVLAQLLASQGRQLLLLDEPLAHTDPLRHLAALDLLSELAQSVQILVFTCHPDRYQPLRQRPDVVAIDLGSGIVLPDG
jgi:DNA repair exonuclease SbcCD ATPase subunit